MSDTGIIYLMSTAVKGLVKIGKTGTNNFEQRMLMLESNGYQNVTSLRRQLAIKVSDYDKKEKLIHVLLEKSRVGQTELFATDINMVKQLLLAFEGELIYPEHKDKEIAFDQAAGIRHVSKSKSRANSEIKKKHTHYGDSIKNLIEAEFIKSGDRIYAKRNGEEREATITADGKILYEDVLYKSPSGAGQVAFDVISINGWSDWYLHSLDGKSLAEIREEYRRPEDKNNDKDMLREK